jgi:hypothetical protein
MLWNAHSHTSPVIGAPATMRDVEEVGNRSVHAPGRCIVEDAGPHAVTGMEQLHHDG